MLESDCQYYYHGNLIAPQAECRMQTMGRSNSATYVWSDEQSL